MHKPAAIFALSILVLVIVGEAVLWRERTRKLPPWKFRALMYGVCPVLLAVQIFTPGIGKRLDLIMYGGILLLVVLVVILSAYVSRATNNLNNVLQEARELHSLGQSSRAIDLLSDHRPAAARISKATESILLSQMAGFAFEMKDTAAAERYLQEAELRSPQNQGIYTTRAEMRAAALDLNGACDALKSGIEKLPTSAWLHTELAERLTSAGRLDEARDALAKAIELIDHEKYVDVVDPVDWQEKRIAPLLKRLMADDGRPHPTV